MSVEKIERCDCCGEDVRALSYDGGVRIYRAKVRSFWRWHGNPEEPKGEVTVCGDCWRGIARAVTDRREAGEA